MNGEEELGEEPIMDRDLREEPLEEEHDAEQLLSFSLF